MHTYLQLDLSMYPSYNFNCKVVEKGGNLRISTKYVGAYVWM